MWVNQINIARYPSLSYHLKKKHKRRFNVAGDIIFDPHNQPQRQIQSQPQQQQNQQQQQQQQNQQQQQQQLNQQQQPQKQQDDFSQHTFLQSNNPNNILDQTLKNEINNFDSTFPSDLFPMDDNNDFKDDLKIFPFDRDFNNNNNNNNTENSQQESLSNLVTDTFTNPNFLQVLTPISYDKTNVQSDQNSFYQFQSSSSLTLFHPPLPDLKPLPTPAGDASSKTGDNYLYSGNNLLYQTSTDNLPDVSSSENPESIFYSSENDAVDFFNTINPFSYDLLSNTTQTPNNGTSQNDFSPSPRENKQPNTNDSTHTVTTLFPSTATTNDNSHFPPGNTINILDINNNLYPNSDGQSDDCNIAKLPQNELLTLYESFMSRISEQN